LRFLRPLSIEPQSFYASRLNLSREYSRLIFLARGLALFFCGKLCNPVQKSARLCEVMSLVRRGQHFGKVIDDRAPRLFFMLLSCTFSRQRCVAGHAQSCRRALQGKQGSTSGTYGRRRAAQHPNLELPYRPERFRTARESYGARTSFRANESAGDAVVGAGMVLPIAHRQGGPRSMARKPSASFSTKSWARHFQKRPRLAKTAHRLL